MKEFDFIQRYIKPIASASGFAQGLQDDAAHIPLSALDGDLVVTVDTIVAGTHFLPDDPAKTLAQKAIRVNLSDLAAKGARPLGLLLALSLPKGTDEAWLKDFSEGLAQDCETFAAPLIGGDTTSTSGPLTISLTALGTAARPALKRSGARPGQLLCVSGAIGWGWLGLQQSLGLLELPVATAQQAIAHYRSPEPQMALGAALLDTSGVGASMDISDGLIADARHLAEASSLKVEIDLSSVPLAAETLDPLSQISGGDDYQLLFSLDEQSLLPLQAGFPLVQPIGRLTQGSGLVLLDHHKQPIALNQEGFVHGR